ncbi:hypothetical protein MLD52_05505 [Puniceicoccaceae bacterium K14]|nr:hypothetical protein [Puniceicoccaceae bacterium K14]
MKTIWKLLLPDWCHLDTLRKSSKPFHLWTIGNKPLLGHWMDHAVNSSIDLVEIYTADRPKDIRTYLNDGAYWSRNVVIKPITNDEAAPNDAIPIVGLPVDNKCTHSLENSNDLVIHWIDLNRQWLENLDQYSLKIEVKHGTGGWIGPNVRIHPEAKLVAPYWIEGQCEIGQNAQIGPNTCISENTIIDKNAIVKDSIVMAGTLVGQNTELNKVVVDGGLLIDSKHGCRVVVTDSFILSSIGKSLHKATILERLIAAFAYIVLFPIVTLKRVDWSTLEAHDGKGGFMTLKTGNQGPLIIRRFHWLKAVMKGRMKLIGILPRPENWENPADKEIEQRLKETAPGLVSLSDCHDCHNTEDPEEWIHASYQAVAGGKQVIKVIRRNFWRTIFKHV